MDQDQNTNQDTDQDTLSLQEAEALATERVEHYLRLHAYVEQLRQDKRPAPPGALTPEDVRAFQMAVRFRAAAPGAATPNSAFVASLRTSIRLEVAAAATRQSSTKPPTAAEARSTRQASARRGVSRRALLGVSLSAAAAGLAAGAALGRSTEPARSGQQPAGPLVPAGAGVWVAVAAVQDLPLGGVKRFATEAIVGYVRHTPSGFAALSGICTHMGCLLQWNSAARTYDCPCHGGRFAENGDAMPTSPVWRSSLAQIAARVQGNTVEVFIPPTPNLSGAHLDRSSATRGANAGYQARQ